MRLCSACSSHTQLSRPSLRSATSVCTYWSRSWSNEHLCALPTSLSKANKTADAACDARAEQSVLCCAVLPACLPDCQSARVRRFIHTVFGFRFSVHFERENCADVLAAEWQSSAWCNRHTHSQQNSYTNYDTTDSTRTHARTQRKATVARNKNHALPATYTRSARSSYSYTRLVPPSNASTGAFTIFTIKRKNNNNQLTKKKKTIQRNS